MPDGTVIEQFCLTNNQGVSLEILSLGGIIRRWLIPHNAKPPTDIVLGFDSVQAYLSDDSYLGALVGRYANRIAEGKLCLESKNYQLDINQGDNCLHGGSQGFNNKVWQSTVLSRDENPAIALQLESPDGDQGFPGALSTKVIYTLTESNRLKIEYFATSKRTTVFNPTNHSYFNLSGHNSGSVNNQHIQVVASYYTPTDAHAIPTGELIKVEGTPFDFRKLSTIEQALTSAHPQIQYGNGLDHNLCIDSYDPQSQEAKYAAKATSENTDISLKVYTTMPGIQVFTANHFDHKKGKQDSLYHAHQGLCFETQFYPDSPNQPQFPSATLKAGEAFYSVTEYEVLF